METRYVYISEGSLEVKLPTICRDGKAEVGRVREEKSRSKKWEDQRRERVGSKKMQVREKVGKSRFTVFWSKSNLAKAAGAEPAGQMKDEKLHTLVARSTFPSQKCTKHTMLGPLLEVEMSKKCTPLWREAHFQVKMYKAHHSQTTFGS